MGDIFQGAVETEIRLRQMRSSYGSYAVEMEQGDVKIEPAASASSSAMPVTQPFDDDSQSEGVLEDPYQTCD